MPSRPIAEISCRLQSPSQLLRSTSHTESPLQPLRSNTCSDRLRVEIEGTDASERVNLGNRKCGDETLARRIGAETRDGERAHGVEDQDNIEPPALGEEAALPSRKPRVVLDHVAGGGIEAFTGAERVLLDEEANTECTGEGVGKLHEADGSGQAGKSEEVGDGAGEDKGDGPVEGNDDCPQQLAGLGGQRRCLEKFHQDIVVDDFDANVAVKGGSNDSAKDAKHVADGLPAIRRKALVRNLCSISNLSPQVRMRRLLPGRHIALARSRRRNRSRRNMCK